MPKILLAILLTASIGCGLKKGKLETDLPASDSNQERELSLSSSRSGPFDLELDLSGLAFQDGHNYNLLVFCGDSAAKCERYLLSDIPVDQSTAAHKKLSVSIPKSQDRLLYFALFATNNTDNTSATLGFAAAVVGTSSKSISLSPILDLTLKLPNTNWKGKKIYAEVTCKEPCEQSSFYQAPWIPEEKISTQGANVVLQGLAINKEATLNISLYLDQDPSCSISSPVYVGTYNLAQDSEQKGELAMQLNASSDAQTEQRIAAVNAPQELLDHLTDTDSYISYFVSDPSSMIAQVFSKKPRVCFKIAPSRPYIVTAFAVYRSKGSKANECIYHIPDFHSGFISGKKGRQDLEVNLQLAADETQLSKDCLLPVYPW